MMNKLDNLKAYYASLGFDEPAIAQIIAKTWIRDLDLIKQKVAFYHDLLRVDQATLLQLIVRKPKILDYSIDGRPTAVQNKFQNLQETLHIDAAAATKMLLTFPNLLDFNNNIENTNSVQNKVKELQALLQVDFETVAKIFKQCPALVSSDFNSDHPAAICHKIDYLKTTLQVDDPTFAQMVTKAPSLLLLNVNKGANSLVTKIDKLSELIPSQKLHACLTDNPRMLCIPAQAFKIRYLLAENYGVMPRFLTRGCFTNQNKVWARASHLNHKHPGIFKMTNIYLDERTFQATFGTKSADLIQRYPLDQAAVESIENDYFRKTGTDLFLDQQERAALGL